MTTPKANNNLNSLGTFFQRTVYKNEVYPKDISKPIDLWYEKPLYGKINNLSESIFVSELFLKQLKSDKGKMIMTLNFVADAFEDFRLFIKRSIKQIKIDVSDSEFADVDPRNGWNNVNELYQSHMNAVYEVFRDVFIKDHSREQRIKDFNSFLKVFVEYVDSLAHFYPFTRTSFVMTKLCPIEISGLSIQLREANHAMDQEKYENFIRDRNYAFYVKAAQQHGFMVDKNAPWRLVADVGSPAIIPYMNKYNVTPKYLFDAFYYKSHQTELEVLKVYVTQFYNSFVAAEPFLKITKTSALTNGLVTERFSRKMIDMNDFDDNLWLKLYAYIRAKETMTKMSKNIFDRMIVSAQMILLKIDKIKAIEYIDRRLNNKHLLSIEEKSSMKELLRTPSVGSNDFSFF